MLRRVAATLLLACASATPPPAPVPTAPRWTGLASGLTTIDDVKARMKTVAAALGVKCSHCHDAADFEAATPQKKIANLMWERMAQNLETADGKDVFCDHCHQGRATFLDRSNEEALKAWMKANFVEKLAPRDGSKMECDTCHKGKRGKFLPRE